MQLEHQLKKHIQVMKTGLVCKQTAVLVVPSIILDNNNYVLADFQPFFSPDTLPHTSVGLTDCISIVFFSCEYFDSFDHYAVGYVPLMYKDDLLPELPYRRCVVDFFRGVTHQ